VQDAVLSTLAVGRFSKHIYKHDSTNSVWQTCVTTVTRHLDRIRCKLRSHRIYGTQRHASTWYKHGTIASDSCSAPPIHS